MAKNAGKSAHPENLLVELLTEELPPKSLKTLAKAFGDGLTVELRQDGFLKSESITRVFATPRRLAVLISHVLERSPDKRVEFTGPPVTAPQQAISGFARKNGVSIEDLIQIDTPKGKIFAYRAMARGSQLGTNLDLKVEEALKRLPIPKIMRWGDGDARFARPVHSLVMLHGDRVVPGRVLGLDSGNLTQGHRFLGKSPILLRHADEYETRLGKDGWVIADFAARREAIERQLQAEATKQKAGLGGYQGLLDEVTALVEYPQVYAGSFDASFLEVPQECLILTMRQNQKYFPLFDAAGKLLPRFLIVSNMKVADPRHIVAGNERVVRPRLEDARFFYNQDRKLRLEERVPQLAKVVYHSKLGSQLDRVKRLEKLSRHIAEALEGDRSQAERAAHLSKADLLTGMVGEFPELQGTMGRYYALHDGEPKVIADAIEEHYRPRFAKDHLPEGLIACSVALADKLDTLVGMYSVGGAPTGEKDTFALRRHALGVLRILMESQFKLDLHALLRAAEEKFPSGTIRYLPEQMREFLRERLRNFLRDQGQDAQHVEAVVSQLGGLIHQVPARLNAVKQFTKLPEAKDLAAANKRVLNIIRKNEEIGYTFKPPQRSLMKEPAELALMDAVDRLSPLAEQHFEAGDYESSLRILAGIKPDVDRFFDKVMVMVDDEPVRNNRAALLQQLGRLMNRVADISKLAA